MRNSGLFAMGFFSIFSFFSCSHNTSSTTVADYPKTFLTFDLGKAVNYDSGIYEAKDASYMSDFHFYRVHTGDQFFFDTKGYEYQIAFYNEDIEDRFIYTYCYSDEENWSTFTKNINAKAWNTGLYSFTQDGYARVIIHKKFNRAISQEEKQSIESSCFFVRQDIPYQEKPYFTPEIQSVADSVNSLKTEDTLTFALLTDNHYVINGHWEDTAHNLQAVNKKVNYDALIHLGDYTDGMTPASITKEYFGTVYDDMKKLNVPLFLVLGNHDANYFRNNPESLNVDEQSHLYLQNDLPYYYKDFDSKKLRILFLYSFDHTQVGQNNRYGFPIEEVEWVKKTLDNTPSDYKVLICSHVPLLPEMHFWSDAIRNGPEMIEVLESFNKDSKRILAFLHGHTHCDQINSSLSFPIVSIGCAKIEDEQEKKVEGSVTYHRKVGDVTQELWDVLVLNTKTGKLNFVRFGAGKDREI